MKFFATRRIVNLIWLIASFGLLLFVAQSTPTDRSIAARTLGLGLAASVVAIPLGGCLAWVCLGRSFISRLVLLTTISLLIVPVFLHLSTWDAAFGRLGWLTSTEGQVLIPLVSGWQAAAWIHGIAAAPQVALLLLIGLSTGRRTFEEQAILDTSHWGVFWQVTIRRLWPLVLLSMLWTMIGCAREIAATDLYQVGTLAEQIYLGYSLGQIDAIGGNWTAEQMAAAGNLNPNLTLAIIIWMAATAITIFVRLTDLEWESDQQQPQLASRQSHDTSRLAAGRSMVGLILLLIFAVVPIGNVIARCGYAVRPINGVPTPSYSINQFVDTLKRAIFDYTTEFGWSALIAATAATIILVLAVGLAWLARRSRVWQMVFVLSLAVACAIPGPLTGSFISRAFTATDMPFVNWLYDRTILAPVLANICFCWPLIPLVVWYVFRKIASDALEHSQLEGAGKGTQFARFGLQGNVSALAGCWLIAWSFSFGELSASQLVLPPGIDTIPRLMLGLLHAGVDEMTAALTIISIGLMVLVSIVGWRLIGLRSDRRLEHL